MIREKKRKKGTVYEAVVRFKGRHLSKSFASWQEANKWVNEVRFRRDHDKGPYMEPVKVQSMFDAYERWAREKDRRESTLKQARMNFKNHILAWYADVDMNTVTLEEHQAFFNSMLEAEKGPAIRNRVRSLLQVMYSVAIKQRLFGGVFKANPFHSIEAAKEPEKVVRAWSFEEKEAFLEANRGSYYYPIFFFLLNTGARVGEALALNCEEQIDRKSQLWTVDRHFSSRENRIVLETKSRRFRTIYLIDEVMSHLDVSSSGLSFTRPDGSPIGYFYFAKKVWPQACKNARVRNLGPHGTRHTFASHYFMDGGRLEDLCDILGHSSIEVTRKRYGHFDVRHIRNRMKVVEKRGNVLLANFG